MNLRQYKEKKYTFSNLEKDVEELKIEIKAYKKNLKFSSFLVTLLLVIIAFFGYDKFDSIEKKILAKANFRLAKTDSLLNSIDDNMIKKLRDELTQNTKLYKQTLKNMEEAIKSSKDLEMVLLKNLPANNITNNTVSTYITKDPHNMFNIREFDKEYKSGDEPSILLILEDLNVDIKIEFINIRIENNKDIIVRDYAFESRGKFNKLKCSLNISPGKYKASIGLMIKEGDIHSFYREVRNLVIK